MINTIIFWVFNDINITAWGLLISYRVPYNLPGLTTWISMKNDVLLTG